MMVNKIIVANPNNIAKNAAKSFEVCDLANVIIIGLIVWKSVPPTINGAETAANPVKNVKIVNAKIVGNNVGNTILNNTLAGLAPIFLAASIV